jgi:hypothetical protein
VTDKHLKDDAASGWAEFCASLRARREGLAMSLEHVARVTRIPATSLARLERGAFGELPADVFVCGFLRSYARCVGLDPDEVVARYRACRGEQWRATEEHPVVAPPVEPGPADIPGPRASAEPDPGPRGCGESTMRTRLQATGSFVVRQLFEDKDNEGSRRGAVTLAVIIVVIVATLTMSYLLRRPSSPGHGLTRAPAEAAAMVAAATADAAELAARCSV